MKQPVYIFDIDGVLNDVEDYETDLRVVQQIAELLENGAFVAINTGRGYEWVETNVVEPIRSRLRGANASDRLFVSVEMGGLGVEFPDGREEHVRSAFSLTQDQIAQVKQIFEAYPEYADRLHWYAGKETMATLEKAADTALERFRPAQQAFGDILQGKLRGQHLVITRGNDALDIHAPEAGKWAGAQLIYDWLRRVTDIAHDSFICFGDSLADYEMARFFAGQNRHTTFVFTGPPQNAPEEAPGITLIKTAQPYHEGTYRYLQAVQLPE